jgi:hypothetical protein
MWKVNLPMLQLMLYDAPHYINKKENGEQRKPVKPKGNILEQFRSRIQDYK